MRRSTRWSTAVVCMVATLMFVVAACGDKASQSTTTNRGATTTTVRGSTTSRTATTTTTTGGTTTAPTDTAPPLPPLHRITLLRSGGIDGGTVGVEVGPDSVVRVRRMADAPFEPGPSGDLDQLRRLQSLVGSVEFQALEAYYGPEDRCCDRFEYILEVAIGGGTAITTEVVFDDAVVIPPILEEMFDILLPLLPD